MDQAHSLEPTPQTTPESAVPDVTLVSDFGSFEDKGIPTARKGFVIYSPRDKYSTAKCFEGFSLKPPDPHPDDEIIEPGVLDLFYVTVSDEGKGIGTDLIGRAVAEAHKRGFTLIRASVQNPKILRIFQKLQEQGVVNSVKYIRIPYDTTITAPSTQEIIASDNTLTYKEAEDFLNSLPRDEREWIDDIGSGILEAVLGL